MSGTGSFILACTLLFLSSVHANMPSQLQDMLSNTEDTGMKFWGMSKNHPIRKELERNPGVYLGTEDNFDLSKLRRGNIEKISTDLRKEDIFSGIPEIFGRNTRSEEDAQCHIQIQVTETYPGRCIRLRNSMPACQNDDYISINYDECD